MWKLFELVVTGSFAAMVTFGGFAQEPQAEKTAAKATKGEADLAALDAEVIEAALIDLMKWEDSPLLVASYEKKEIWITEEPGKTAPDLEFLVDERVESGRSVSKALVEPMKETAKDMIRRAEENDFLKSFTPKDNRVHIFTKKHEEDYRKLERDESSGYVRRPQDFEFLAPGYTKDRRFAIVHFRFPWGWHGGSGTFLIEKQDKKWVAVMRRVEIPL